MDEAVSLPFVSEQPSVSEMNLDQMTDSLRNLSIASHAKLLPELLSQIFLSCCDFPIHIPPKLGEAALRLPQVCSAWRQVALKLPELWANVHISYTDEMSVRRSTVMLEEWIARAGSDYPLNITVVCPQPFGIAAAETPELFSGSIVSFIVANANRIRHFTVALPFMALRPIFDVPSGSFKVLETAVLEPLIRLSDVTMPDSEAEFCGWHWPSDSVAFDCSPLLRELSYHVSPLFKLPELELLIENIMDLAVMDQTLAVRHQFYAPPLSLPRGTSARLTVVSFPLTALTSDTWCDILAECPDLTTLAIAIKPSQSLSTPSSMLHLDRLANLILVAFTGYAHTLLDRLVAPHLDTFTFLGTTVPVTEFLAFQTRSSFTLTAFILTGFLPGDDVLRLFRNLDRVTEMGIPAISTEHFPVEFWDGVGRGEILPQLGFLLLRPTAVQAPVLVDMIAARWDGLEASQSGSEVPNFIVQFSDMRAEHMDAIKEEFKKLEKYKESGREVSMEVLL
ncbi:hypothetical protein FB45DRAFT_926916 [Roridomyces roridus]|uniref:F-box domain-containing protein n=1 Tax=Roridomyces roridus TaxID=1738132 RepID=A0AAD7FFX9_9AGAR|nr:hypothetical protein FB45DRAFT_926916 [Roridomyces roridus]